MKTEGYGSLLIAVDATKVPPLAENDQLRLGRCGLERLPVVNELPPCANVSQAIEITSQTADDKLWWSTLYWLGRFKVSTLHETQMA